jgi:hypothetical protein
MLSLEVKNRSPTPPKLPVIVSHLCHLRALGGVAGAQMDINGHVYGYLQVFVGTFMGISIR